MRLVCGTTPGGKSHDAHDLYGVAFWQCDEVADTNGRVRAFDSSAVQTHDAAIRQRPRAHAIWRQPREPEKFVDPQTCPGRGNAAGVLAGQSLVLAPKQRAQTGQRLAGRDSLACAGWG